MSRRLLVVRDRAHARDAARDAASAVWTWRELVERLCNWALLDLGHVRDDRAPLWAIAQTLAPAQLSPRIAHDADELRRALLHGGTSSAEVSTALGRDDELAPLFSALSDADARLAQAKRADGAAALSHAARLLEKGRAPAALSSFDVVELRDLVEPSDLELRIVIALARSRRVVCTVPVDGASRGLLVAVEPVLRTLEAAHDAPGLEIDLDDVSGAADFADCFYGSSTAPDAPVEVHCAPDEAAEASEVADVVAAWRRANPSARIAVCVRVLDESAARIADALAAHGLPVQTRRRRLLECPAARLLLDVIALARDGAPRDRLVAVLASPALRASLTSAQAARVMRSLRLAAARTDVEDHARPRGGYRHRLDRFRHGLDPREARDAARIADIDDALVHVERALAFAQRLPQSAPLPAHLDALCALCADIFESGHGLGCSEVQDVLEESRRAASVSSATASTPVELPAVSALIERALEREPGLTSPVEADDAVELLALPEIWGRKVDHVVVAGCVEGRLPRSERKERLLGDGDRIRINSALGRRVLRLLDDDPLEPSPLPRAQAFEPLWMLGALRAASSSLLLTMPLRDGRGRELPPSVFLLEALRVLGVAEPSEARSHGTALPRSPSPRAAAVRAATLRARGLVDADAAGAAGIDANTIARADLAKQMSQERARFFFGKRSAPYAFAVSPARIAGAFAGSFGFTPERPLTPTRLEALAECRMHGFMQHVLKIDVDPPAGNAADARVLGTLAHGVLERFFRERKERAIPASSIGDGDRARVRAILAEDAALILDGRRATGHLGAIRAQIRWLETALVRAVSMLARDPPVPGVEPQDFEVKIGTRDAALTSVPLTVGERKLWLGGVIDRVDEGNGARVVLDYKSAGTGAIKAKAHRDVLFEKHFQLLLYLRLLEHHRATAAHVKLHGYLVSLRDGTTSDDVAEVASLRERIVDDSRDDGLAAGVARVIMPILEGTVPPDAGDRCETCRLQRVCRVPLAAEFAPDLDEPDDGGSA